MGAYNSLEWQPIGEICGACAWSSTWVPPLNYKTKCHYERYAKEYAELALECYEDRRIFEDAMGRIKWAARLASPKSWREVIKITKILEQTKEPVKIKAAYEILEWFIIGQSENHR